MAQPQYLSTDPNAGSPVAASGGYLSTDPNAGEQLSSMAALKPMASHRPGGGDDLGMAAAMGGGVSPAVADATGRSVVEAGQGARAAAASTVYHGGDLIRRATGTERVIDRPSVQASMTPPNTAAGKTGFMAERAAEFALPVSKVTRATEAAPFFTRVMAEAGTGAGVAGVQTGGDPASMITQAGTAVLVPVASHGLRTARTVAAGAREGGVGGAVAAATRTVVGVEPKAAMVQALKPRSTNTGFTQALDRALPEIKVTEAEIGKPIESVQELLDATKRAKQRVWSQYEQFAGPQRAMGATVDGGPIADAIEKSIPSKLKLEDPRAAAAIMDKADKYRRSFKLEEAEQLLMETNADLEAFYAKYPMAQRRALLADPEAARLNAQAETLRKIIYAKLDTAGEGAAAAELKRRYGALLKVEEEATRRANVAARQQPESLSEQIGKVRAAADTTRGVYRIYRGDFGGAADIAAARAGRATATYLKEQQTSDALIRRAFAAYKGAPIPVPMPVHRPVRGALPPGARQMGPAPDASFVRSVPARTAQNERLALPPGRPPIAAPAPETSSVRSVPAKSTVQRDPRTGRMRRVYSSDER